MNIEVNVREATNVNRQGDPQYALGNLESAVYELAVGQGDVRSRLIEAHRVLSPLSENDFPEELAADWLWIDNEWTKSGPMMGPDGTERKDAFNNTLDSMRNAGRVDIAKRIYSLTEALQISISAETTE